MFGRLLHRLDAFGTDDPDFREGFPEDRCPVCDRPVSDHPASSPFAMAFGTSGRAYPAKWPHRRAAAIELLLDRL